MAVASIGHVAVGFMLARGASAPPERRWASFVTFAGLALFPDADVIGLALGVPYAADWGHRGATHSFVFAAIAAPLFGFFAPQLGLSRLRATVFALAALASHGLLDAMTTGGLGVALLWPADTQRIFFSWRPIPVAPIGLAIFRPAGLALMLHEAGLFLPCWLIAFAPGAFQKKRYNRDK